jgi:hypothetical protein
VRDYPGPEGVAGTGGRLGARAGAEDRFQRAHEASYFAGRYFPDSQRCGCFCCSRTFPAAAIIRVFGWEVGCPYCGIDAVLPDAAGLPIDRDFLLAMRTRWYGDVANALSGPID